MKTHGIEKRALAFIKENHLIEANSILPVAVSGGPDSVCLLYVLNSIKDDLGITLHVIHLDHQLRGLESEADARFVNELAEQLNIPVSIETRDVNTYRNKYRLTLEEAAREVRYSYFAAKAAEIGADRIAVGHTLDDNIETILMHLIRGTGIRGLCGLQPEHNWQLGDIHIKVIRPLLPISRKETQDYCLSHRLTPRMDETNLSISPLRNKIRLQLLPMLAHYNPNIKSTLLRTAKTAGDELDYFEKLQKITWSKTAKKSKNTIIFDKEIFVHLHPAIQRHVLRTTFDKLVGNLKDIELRHIEEILAALNKPAGKIINLPYGLIFSIEYDRYLLTETPAELSPFPAFEGDYDINIPGLTTASGWKIKTVFVKPEQMKKTNRFTAFLDYEKTGDKLKLRTCHTGDRFQPLGMESEKKVGEFMIDARIPHAWRNRIPILYSPSQILWIVGHRIDDRAKVTEKSTKVIKINFKIL